MQREHLALTFYVTDRDGISMRVHERLWELCSTHLPGKYTIRVVDMEAPAEIKKQNVIGDQQLSSSLPEPIHSFLMNLKKTKGMVLTISQSFF